MGFNEWVLLGAVLAVQLPVLWVVSRFRSFIQAERDRLHFVQEQLKEFRADAAVQQRMLREELSQAQRLQGDLILKSVMESASQQVLQNQNLTGSVFSQLQKVFETHERQQSLLRQTLQTELSKLQEDNQKKLDQIRETVEQKLHGALEKKLGESFKQVSDRLEQVHKGLGEMQSLAVGVGDLKKVLTNVKSRGTWGEVQLGMLLEQMLSPEQFVRGFSPKKGSLESVEYAVKLPGRTKDQNEPVYLPIDAKFPQEDYLRLVEAQERGDLLGVEQAIKSLEDHIKKEAKTISDKYIQPPMTTDFAILYLPTEGLFAEVLRRPGLIELLQRDFRVTIAGPTTLSALLNSLQLGFRTLAIEKRSSEVWQILGAVKLEFGRFGDLMDKVQKKLQEASHTIEDASRKGRTIERKLKDVQGIPVVVDELPSLLDI